MNLRSAFLAALESNSLVASRLAVTAGITDSQISFFKSGRRDLNVQTLQKLLDALPAEAYQEFVGYLGQRDEVDSVEAAIALLETSNLSNAQMARLMVAGAKHLTQQDTKVQEPVEVLSVAA